MITCQAIETLISVIGSHVQQINNSRNERKHFVRVHLVMEKAKKSGAGLLKFFKQSHKSSSSKVRDSIVVIGVKQAMLIGMLSAEDGSKQAFKNEESFEDIETYSGNSSSTELTNDISLALPSSESLSKPRGKLVR